MGLQDAPAGKYGWLKNGNGHFEFERRSGVPQRFYGVNLCFEANYPEKPMADELVTRLVRFGYNTLRVHHHDGPRGFTKDVEDGLNAEQMDKLDYLLAKCFEKGIYVTTDLFVSRRNWKPTTVPGEVKGPYKSLVTMNDEAYADWCKYAKLFLDHVNPYTGRRYADEPGLPLLSMFTNCNNGGGEGLMKVRRELFDYVDRHFYIDHPHFLATRWRLPSFCDNVNPLRLETSLIEQYAASQVETKPFTVSEWNFSGPGRYRGVVGGSRSARSASPLRNRGMSRALAFAGSV